MKKAKSLLCILMVLVMAFTLFACNKDNSSSNSGGSGDSSPAGGGSSPAGGGGGNSPAGGGNEGTSGGGGAQPGDDNWVSITVGTDDYLGRFLAGLNPAESWMGCDAIYDTIFRTDPKTKQVFSHVLKDWYWQDDTTLIMEMRDDVYFSNGDNATAEDIIYSYYSHIVRGSNYLNDFGMIWDETKVLDTYTAQFKVEKPFPIFVNSSIYLIDASWSESVGYDSMEWYTPVCSGPYYVHEWVDDSHMVLRSRGDDYWNKDVGPIYVDEWIVRYYPDSSTMYMALEIGDVAMCAVQDTDYSRFIRSGGDGFDVELVQTGTVLYMCFSFNEGDTDIWYDKRLREAIAVGADWDQIGQAAQGDYYIPARSIASSLSPDYIETGKYEYNPERAKELLAECGYGPGNPLKIFTVTMDSPMLRNGFESFQYFMEQIGVEATFEFADVSTALSYWLVPGDTEYGFWWSVGANPTFAVRNAINEAWDPGGVSYDYVPFPEFLEHFEILLRSTDDAAKSAAGKWIQQYMYDEIIYIPVTEFAFSVGWREDVFTKQQVLDFQLSRGNYQLSRLGLASAWK